MELNSMLEVYVLKQIKPAEVIIITILRTETTLAIHMQKLIVQTSKYPPPRVVVQLEHQPAVYAPKLSADLSQNKPNSPGAKAPGECQKNVL